VNIFAEKPGNTYSVILDLPPSAKFVLYILYRKGKLNRKDIRKESLLPKRTVGFALRTLLDKDLVKKSSPRKMGRKRIDYRKIYYEILY